LEHATKVVERIFEQRIHQHIDTDDMQFGFLNCKWHYFGFADLEKAFDRSDKMGNA